jgi:hypothetical protein
MSERRWMSNWVVLGMPNLEDLELLVKRPFVLSVHVDAPLGERFRRSGMPR